LVVIDSLAADASVRLVGGVRLKVNSAGEGAAVVLGAADDTSSGEWYISGPDSGSAVCLSISEVVPGGRIVYGGQMTLRSWKSKVALWSDATAADSITYLRDVNADATSVDEAGVLWWRDCRPSQTNYAWAMARFATNSTSNLNKYPGLYPILTSGGPNNLDYMYMEGSQHRFYSLSVGTTLNGQSKSQCVEIPSAYAIAVMKGCSSQGLSVFTGDTWDYYSRGGKGASYPMFTNETITVYKDGTEVASPTTTSFGTDWGVYSFTAEEPIIALACMHPAESSQTGGFSFGEILIFSETPTDMERIAAEEYLSQKWAMDISHSNTVFGMTLDLDVEGQTSSALLTLADEYDYSLTVNVSLASDLADGLYPLVCHAGIKSYTLGTVTGISNGRNIALVWQEDTSTLCLRVVSNGTMLIIR